MKIDLTLEVYIYDHLHFLDISLYSYPENRSVISCQSYKFHLREDEKSAVTEVSNNNFVSEP